MIGGGAITLLKNRSAAPSLACAVCGDGVVADPEVCDDDGKVGSDGCSATCGIELGYGCSGAPSTCAPKCGDALIAGSESCDDANTAPGDGCSASCKVDAGWKCTGKPSVCQPSCGDSSVVGSELCDDGNQLDGDSCPSSCRHDLWSFAFGNPGQQDFAERVAFSPQGDVLVVATVNGPVTVASTPLPAMGERRGAREARCAGQPSLGKAFWRLR
ncbi:MAG: DUF4215 domain-containing protein [Myxococcales bacterium]|nr:DUF4215 domain-containing protein [Myxococcales bacterium]